MAAALPADLARAPVTALPGVGTALAVQLARLGLARVQDLWFHLPLRYEDRTRVQSLADLRPGDSGLVSGWVRSVEQSFRYRAQLKLVIEDASGALLGLRFFHFHKAQVNLLREGVRLLCYGEAREGALGLEMVHPSYRQLDENQPITLAQRLSPVYPVIQGLGQQRLGKVMAAALECLPAAEALELIPVELAQPLDFASLREALLYVHRPPPEADLDSLRGGRHPARRRLAFEELLAQHLSLKRLRAAMRDRKASPLQGDGVLRGALRAALPFQLTAAQQRVVEEIAADLTKSAPMLRLVQGDVGSGKTVVAALAALAAVEAGYQVALMAPTELLAEQHRQQFQAWLEPLGVEVAWLAGKLKGRARSQSLARIAQGSQVVIGTHALMQEGVQFQRLGLVIVDEQHRFGVQQRLALTEKGHAADERVPHQLVMTATPIPRTLAMSAYADLDVSSIDMLPPGRAPVHTVALSQDRRRELIERLAAACEQGRQVYWVCTLIEESEQLKAQAAEAAHAELTAALPGYQVGLVHGRMKAGDKQAVMAAFKTGEIAVLVATTVIEVGVDVPRASLMVIENSERLGLAQLHQLRGRVGRGAAASSCVLLYQPPLGQLARERLKVMRESNDGFRIAEQDLQLRGPGEVLGTRQTGQLNFRIADLGRDGDLLPAVQQVGERLLSDYPCAAERLLERWIGAAVRYAQA